MVHSTRFFSLLKDCNRQANCFWQSDELRRLSRARYMVVLGVSARLYFVEPETGRSRRLYIPREWSHAGIHKTFTLSAWGATSAKEALRGARNSERGFPYTDGESFACFGRTDDGRHGCVVLSPRKNNDDGFEDRHNPTKGCCFYFCRRSASGTKRSSRWIDI